MWRCAAALLGALLLVLLPVHHAPDPDAARLQALVDAEMQSGLRALKGGDPSAALGAFLQAAGKLPSDSELHGRVVSYVAKAKLAVGDTLLERGQVEEGVKAYESVAADELFQGPGSVTGERVKARKTLATMAHNSGKLEVAAEHFDAMLTDNPGDFQSRQKYNWILAGMGDIGAALWHYGRACHAKVCGQQWDRGFSHNMAAALSAQLHRLPTGQAAQEAAAEQEQAEAEAAEQASASKGQQGRGRRKRNKKRKPVTSSAALALAVASAEELALFEKGDTPLSAWQGAMPKTMVDQLALLRPGSVYWDTTQALVAESVEVTKQPGQTATDSGFVSWWSPRSALDNPSNLIEQVIGNYLLPLLPKDVQGRVVGSESWGHTKNSQRFPYSVPGHRLHFDADTLHHSAAGVMRFPLFTCLLWIDAGGGYGGATVVLDQSRDDDGPHAPADRGWVFAPRSGDVMCFNSTRNHGVLPGIVRPKERKDIKQAIKVGQRRMSINVAFWGEIPCTNGAFICKSQSGTAAQGGRSADWDWQSTLPLWTAQGPEDAEYEYEEASSAASADGGGRGGGGGRIALSVPQVDQPWAPSGVGPNDQQQQQQEEEEKGKKEAAATATATTGGGAAAAGASGELLDLSSLLGRSVRSLLSLAREKGIDEDALDNVMDAADANDSDPKAALANIILAAAASGAS